jgi:hypothetical protein
MKRSRFDFTSKSKEEKPLKSEEPKKQKTVDKNKQPKTCALQVSYIGTNYSGMQV